MREILFRGHDGYEWRYGELANIQTVPQICIEPKCIIGPFSFTIDPETIGQYTGQTTLRRDIKIFEGDTVKVSAHMEIGCEVHKDFAGSVIFTKGLWLVCSDTVLKAIPLFQELCWWEITGNIHGKKDEATD